MISRSWSRAGVYGPATTRAGDCRVARRRAVLRACSRPTAVIRTSGLCVKVRSRLPSLSP